jgi:hypothetical protein
LVAVIDPLPAVSDPSGSLAICRRVVMVSFNRFVDIDDAYALDQAKSSS